MDVAVIVVGGSIDVVVIETVLGQCDVMFIAVFDVKSIKGPVKIFEN